MNNETIAELAKYRSKHLFLLVGMNPLPNLVAARLLARQGGTVWLLYSSGDDGAGTSTKPQAEKLETALSKMRSDLENVWLRPISSLSNTKIITELKKLLNDKTEDISGTIGLNYTGGTKPMAVHAYQILQTRFEKDITFSYLDPQNLALRIDGTDTTPTDTIPILSNPQLRKSTAVTLGDIVELHGYTPLKNTGRVPDNFEIPPGMLPFCEAINNLHCKPGGMAKWRKWLSDTKANQLPDSAILGADIENILRELCQPEKPTPTRLASVLGQSTLPSCSKWLVGEWLEDYVLNILRKLTLTSDISSLGKGIEFKDEDGQTDEFEFDVAATIGYQLYAFSCMVSEKKSKVKEHFLEAYVRARQLGGDEARAALVCYVEDTEILEREIRRSWDAVGKVKIFGAAELQNLEYHISTWLKTVNQ